MNSKYTLAVLLEEVKQILLAIKNHLLVNDDSIEGALTKVNDAIKNRKEESLKALVEYETSLKVIEQGKPKRDWKNQRELKPTSQSKQDKSKQTGDNTYSAQLSEVHQDEE